MFNVFPSGRLTQLGLAFSLRLALLSRNILFQSLYNGKKRRLVRRKNDWQKIHLYKSSLMIGSSHLNNRNLKELNVKEVFYY